MGSEPITLCTSFREMAYDMIKNIIGQYEYSVRVYIYIYIHIYVYISISTNLISLLMRGFSQNPRTKMWPSMPRFL